MRHVDQGPPSQKTAELWWQRIINEEAPGNKWCCETIDSKEYVGHAMINPYEKRNSFELGYVLAQHQWHKGFATEIAKALAEYSRDTMGDVQIFATADFENNASINVLKKTGFALHCYDRDELGEFPVFILEHKAIRQ